MGHWYSGLLIVYDLSIGNHKKMSDQRNCCDIEIANIKIDTGFFDLKIFNREKNSFSSWPTFGLTRFPL